MSGPIGRRALLAGSGGALASAAAGCAIPVRTVDQYGGGDTSGGVLNILGTSGEISPEQIVAFQREHHCTVRMQEYSYDKLIAMLAANRAPDVVRGEGGPDAPFLYVRELAEPLDPWVAQSSVIKADDLDKINDMWRFDGTTQGKGDLLGLVKDYSSDLCLWVNAELAGEQPAPDEVWSYDKVFDVAKRNTVIKGGRVERYGYDFYAGKPHVMMINAVMHSSGDELFAPDRLSVDFTQPSAVKIVQWFRDLFESRVTTSFLSKTSSDSYQLFKSGRLAVFQSGFWTQGMFSDGKPAELEHLFMIPAPQAGRDRISPVMTGAGMWIPRASKSKDLAWKWMEYYFGEQPAKDRATSGWGVPALKSLKPDMPTKTDLNKRALACQQVEDKFFSVLTFTPYAKIDACNLALTTALEAGIKARTPTPQICADATTALNQLLARGKR